MVEVVRVGYGYLNFKVVKSKDFSVLNSSVQTLTLENSEERKQNFKCVIRF